MSNDKHIEVVTEKILTIRGRRVILDFEIAALRVWNVALGKTNGIHSTGAGLKRQWKYQYMVINPDEP